MATVPPQLLPMPVLGRREAILLLKNVRELYSLSDESRDLAVQLFDSYLARLDQGADLDVQTLILSCVAISSKLLDSSFPSFDALPFSHAEIFLLEQRVLSTLQFLVFPTQTPSFLAHHLIHKWPKAVRVPSLVHSCDMLIGKFWEYEKSASFAPAVVAITAILLAIGKEIPSKNAQVRMLCDFMAFLNTYDLQVTLPSPFTLNYCRVDLDVCLDVFTIVADPHYGIEPPVVEQMPAQEPNFPPRESPVPMTRSEQNSMPQQEPDPTRVSPVSVVLPGQGSDPIIPIQRPKPTKKGNEKHAATEDELDSAQDAQHKRQRV